MSFSRVAAVSAVFLSACSENNFVRINEEDPAFAHEPVADAGADVDTVVGELVKLDSSASYDPDGLEITGYQWFLDHAPDGSVAVPPLTDTKKLTFVPDLDGVYTFLLTVGNENDVWDSTPDEVKVHVGTGDAPVADAGLDAEYEPLDTITLDGTDSYDPNGLEPLQYQWTVLESPPNANVHLDNARSATPTFLAPLAGDYVFELSVTNTAGVEDPTPDQVAITVTPADGFYVEASWPGQADIDLHLSNSDALGIFDCPEDCNFDNPAPSWFAAGSADDPSLDEDTIPGLIGAGPEIITITEPADDLYLVRVHYYGTDGFANCGGACPDTLVTVNVYIGGVLAETYEETLTDAGDVWNVATIQWPSGQVAELDSITSTSKTSCLL